MAKKVKTPLMATASPGKVPSDYSDFLDGLKSRIQTAQLRAAASVNLELTSLYWDMGLGLLKRNLELMRQFAKSYPQGICETAVSQIPWGHNIAVMQRPQQLLKMLLKSKNNSWCL